MDDARLLPLLPSLVALVETASVTAAARRLGVGQPRMSARLAMLRRLTGDRLLTPSLGARGLSPTPRAQALALAAARALRDVEAALRPEVFSPATAERTFTVMANDNAATLVGAPLAGGVAAEGGAGVRMTLAAFDATRLPELEDGGIDLVLASSVQLAAAGATLVTRTVLRDRFAVGVRRGAVADLDLEAFCAREHVIVSGEGAYEGLVDRALAELGRTRRVAASVQSYLLALELVASTDLVATLPRALLARRRCDLAVGAPPLRLRPFTLSAGWHGRWSDDAGHRWLRERLFAVSQPLLADPPEG